MQKKLSTKFNTDDKNKQTKKTLWKVGMEGAYLYKIKTVYDRVIANIILKGEKLKVFPLKLGKRQGSFAFSALLFSIVLEVLAMAIRAEIQIKASKLPKKTKK